MNGKEGDADLWWGSSAYRAEPAESSSVGTPEQIDSLHIQVFIYHFTHITPVKLHHSDTNSRTKS